MILVLVVSPLLSSLSCRKNGLGRDYGLSSLFLSTVGLDVLFRFRLLLFAPMLI